MSFGIVEGSELGRSFVETGVGRYQGVSDAIPVFLLRKFVPLGRCEHTEDRATALPLVANHSTHCGLSMS